jgi:hypothetical protein
LKLLKPWTQINPVIYLIAQDSTVKFEAAYLTKRIEKSFICSW